VEYLYFREHILITSIEDRQDSLLVIIESGARDQKVELAFRDKVYGYRAFEETAWLKSLYKLKEMYGETFLASSTLFTVKNSQFARQISTQSCGIFREDCMIHFAVISEDLILEVLTSALPQVKMLGSS